ncbi:hypothetical protein GCM10027515_24570 [Schumannella luteola]|uniref:DUF4352 domain-containing protein n=1 Tax=Schumannella luteola TaxID=472059 RepID=A0A852YR72_9MICO|nr:hypothetical protein [Schumannella luteola]NYG99745.1 hypothetical protein [Schumannella luteola]TPX06524.1 DUF4352 domain-containing protein [Schumannella luteola]
MKRSARVLASLAALAVAMIAAATAPKDNAAISEPFAVHGRQGEVVSTRLLLSRLDDVEIARTLTTDDWAPQTIDTTGRWVVVHLTVQTRRATESISSARLVVGGREYANYLGLRNDLGSIQNGPGIATRGTIAFEVPTELLSEAAAAKAEVRLQTAVLPSLDDVPTFEVDLRAAPRSRSLVIPEPEPVEPLG